MKKSILILAAIVVLIVTATAQKLVTSKSHFKLYSHTVAEDIEANDDGTFDVIPSFENFGAVKDALDNAQLKAENAEVSMIASNEVELATTESAEKVMRLLDMLEDLDDVQNVYSNASISTEILETL